MGTGPAGEGVLQTSGKAVAMPLLVLWTVVRLFTFRVEGMGSSLRRVDENGCAMAIVGAGPQQSWTGRARAAGIIMGSASDHDRPARRADVAQAVSGV